MVKTTIVSGQSRPLHPAAFFSCRVIGSESRFKTLDLCLVTRERHGSVTAPPAGRGGGVLRRKVPRYAQGIRFCHGGHIWSMARQLGCQIGTTVSHPVHYIPAHSALKYYQINNHL